MVGESFSCLFVGERIRIDLQIWKNTQIPLTNFPEKSKINEMTKIYKIEKKITELTKFAKLKKKIVKKENKNNTK